MKKHSNSAFFPWFLLILLAVIISVGCSQTNKVSMGGGTGGTGDIISSGGQGKLLDPNGPYGVQPTHTPKPGQ